MTLQDLKILLCGYAFRTASGEKAAYYLHSSINHIPYSTDS